MYVAALTANGIVYVFSFELSRVDNWQEIQKSYKNNTVLLDEEGNELLAGLVDYPYSKKYKQMLHQYEYAPKYPSSGKKSKRKNKQQSLDQKAETLDPTEPEKAYIKLDLNNYFDMDNFVNQKRRFLQFQSYQTKSQQYFVILDNLDSFTILNRDLSLKS